MTHPVIHFEILGKDGAALQAFYQSAFDWAVDASNPMNYGMVSAVPGGIAGGVATAMDGTPMVTVYIAVDDLQAALDRVAKLGGTTVMRPMDVPGGPSIAQFKDPEGNLIGLVKGM